MAIEIVDFPINKGDFPVRYVSHYQRVSIYKGRLWLSIGLGLGWELGTVYDGLVKIARFHL